MSGTAVRILLAEDDDDDYLLTEQAFTENRLANRLKRVRDGVELLDYLHGRGPFADRESYPHPALLLLDLNMPRMDGREALAAIKSDPRLRRLPVVVLTTSHAQEDVVRSYDLGVNSFISKPVAFHGLVNAIRALGCYWLEIVELPGACDQRPEEDACLTRRC